MSTPTTRLRLELQALGSGLNTWGVQGLNGIFNVLDESLGGVKEITLTGDHTLTTTNYSSNESRFRNIKFIGSPGSAPTITIPATENWYLIENACGQTITISNSVATGTLANGLVGYVRTNGGSTLSILPLLDQTNGKIVADNIASVNTTATNISNVNTVAGISANVTTTAGISGNVTTVAGVASDVTGVAGISSAVTGVNAIASDVTAVNTDPLKTNIGNVSGNASNINAVSANASNINTVAGINANVTTVAGISSDVTGVNAVASDVTGVNAIASNVTTVAGVASNVTTVAGISGDVTGVNAISSAVTGVNTISSAVSGVNAIASDVSAVNTDPLKSNINTTAGAVTNVNNVGTNIANVNSVASNMASVNSFGNTYQISTNNPTTGGDGSSSLADGMLAWVTSADKLRVYNASSSAWEDAGSAVSGLRQIYQYVATAGQTLFPATGTIDYDQTAGGAAISIFLNGVLLKTTDYTATNGTSVTLASGAALNDEVTIHTFGAFNVANTYSQSAADARFLQISNNLSDVNSASTALSNLGGVSAGKSIALSMIFGG